MSKPPLAGLRTVSILLWAALVFLASPGSRHLENVYDLNQMQTDTIGGVVWLTVALICRYESGSWWSILWVMIPVYGLVYSLTCFWRLPESHGRRKITSVQEAPAPTLVE